MTKTSIEWTEESWNPIVGCSIKSPGCANCYAMPMAARIEAINAALVAAGKPPQAPQYDGTTKIVNDHAVWTGKLGLSEKTLLNPLKRKKPTVYFVNSMGDLFHEDMPRPWIIRVFAVMLLTPQHTYQVLTKRAEEMRKVCSAPDFAMDVWNAAVDIDCQQHLPDSHPCYQILLDPKRITFPLPNVWLGVSTERQPEANLRIPELMRTPAAIRFISYEPALGPLDLTDIVTKDGICEVHRSALECDVAIEDDEEWKGAALDWVICGGESGPDARPMHPDWARSLRDQCAAANVPFFFKQWGTWAPYDRGQVDTCKLEIPKSLDCPMQNFGKKRSGKLLDGAEHQAMPAIHAGDHALQPAKAAQ